ncbi:MAG TPA: hypothetical protein VGI81_04855 [Tepidisphaeraceae bacterium]|jgi:hypothetical protein
MTLAIMSLIAAAINLYAGIVNLRRGFAPAPEAYASDPEQLTLYRRNRIPSRWTGPLGLLAALIFFALAAREFHSLAH